MNENLSNKNYGLDSIFVKNYTCLTGIIENCSDMLEVIFSYLSFDLLLQIRLVCRLFYYYSKITEVYIHIKDYKKLDPNFKYFEKNEIKYLNPFVNCFNIKGIKGLNCKDIIKLFELKKNNCWIKSLVNISFKKLENGKEVDDTIDFEMLNSVRVLSIQCKYFPDEAVKLNKLKALTIISIKEVKDLSREWLREITYSFVDNFTKFIEVNSHITVLNLECETAPDIIKRSLLILKNLKSLKIILINVHKACSKFFSFIIDIAKVEIHLGKSCKIKDNEVGWVYEKFLCKLKLFCQKSESKLKHLSLQLQNYDFAEEIIGLPLFSSFLYLPIKLQFNICLLYFDNYVVADDSKFLFQDLVFNGTLTEKIVLNEFSFSVKDERVLRIIVEQKSIKDLEIRVKSNNVLINYLEQLLFLFKLITTTDNLERFVITFKKLEIIKQYIPRLLKSTTECIKRWKEKRNRKVKEFSLFCVNYQEDGGMDKIKEEDFYIKEKKKLIDSIKSYGGQFLRRINLFPIIDYKFQCEIDKTIYNLREKENCKDTSETTQVHCNKKRHIEKKKKDTFWNPL